MNNILIDHNAELIAKNSLYVLFVKAFDAESNDDYVEYNGCYDCDKCNLCYDFSDCDHILISFLKTFGATLLLYQSAKQPPI